MPIKKRVSFNLDSVLQLDATVVVNSPETKARTDTKQHPSRPVNFFIDQRFPGDLERHNAFRRNPVGSLSLPSSLPPQTPKNSMGDFLGSRRAVMPTQPTRPERLESASPSKSSRNSPSNEGAIEISNNALRNQQRIWSEASESQTKGDQDIQNSLLFSTPLSDEFSRLRTSQGGPLTEVKQKPPSDQFRRLRRSQVRTSQGGAQPLSDEFGRSITSQGGPLIEVEQQPPESVEVNDRVSADEIGGDFVQEIEEFSSPAPENLELVPIEKEAILKCLLRLHYTKGSIKFLGTEEDIEKTNRKLFAFSSIFSRCFRAKDDREKLDRYVFVSRDEIFLINLSKQQFENVYAEIYTSESTQSIESSVIFGDYPDNIQDGFVKLSINVIKKPNSPFGYRLKNAIIKANQEIKLHQQLLSRTSPDIDGQAKQNAEQDDSRQGTLQTQLRKPQMIYSVQEDNPTYGLIEFETQKTPSVQEQIASRNDRLEYLLKLSHINRDAIDLGCFEELNDSSSGCFGKKENKTQEDGWRIRNYFFVLKDRYFVITCSKDTYQFFKQKVLKKTSKKFSKPKIEERGALEHLIRYGNQLFTEILLKDLDSQLIDENLKKRIREVVKKIPVQQGFASSSLFEKSLLFADSEKYEITEPATNQSPTYENLAPPRFNEQDNPIESNAEEGSVGSGHEDIASPQFNEQDNPIESNGEEGSVGSTSSSRSRQNMADSRGCLKGLRQSFLGSRGVCL